jgi:hypothetical protein
VRECIESDRTGGYNLRNRLSLWSFLPCFQGRHTISRSRDLTAVIADASARAVDAVARARKLLAKPPDTFLGRKRNDIVAISGDAICSRSPARQKAAYRAYILNDHGGMFTFAEARPVGRPGTCVMASI